MRSLKLSEFQLWIHLHTETKSGWNKQNNDTNEPYSYHDALSFSYKNTHLNYYGLNLLVEATVLWSDIQIYNAKPHPCLNVKWNKISAGSVWTISFILLTQMDSLEGLNIIKTWWKGKRSW